MNRAILMYHSLDESGSVISISPAQFADQAARLSACGRPIVPLKQLMDTPSGVALTFDDGFRNFSDVAVPVLERYRLPATVFVVSGKAGQCNNWPPASASIPELPLMTWDEIRSLPSALVSVGAHSVTHPDLTQLPPECLRSELAGSRSFIEDQLGRAVETFAYPFGAMNHAVRDAAAAHYALACGTRLETASAADPFDLPRIDAYYLRGKGRFAAFVEDRGRAYLAGRRLLRNLRAQLSSR